MRNFIYAETAFHHEGDFEYLISLINMAKDCGANGIKFQVLSHVDKLISKKHSAYDILKQFTLPLSKWDKAFDHATKLGLEIIVMPLDVGCFDLIEKHKKNIHGLELHSVSFHDHLLLKEMKKSGVPIMLGIGGRTREEIDEIREFLGNQLKILIVGFQAFPSKIKDVKLGRIPYLKNRYPNISIGYADHSGFSDPMGIRSFEYAYLLGATYFEKHITIEEGEKRVDYEAAVGKDKFCKIIETLTDLTEVIPHYESHDSSVMKIEGPEINYRNRQKVAIAARYIEKGEVLNDQNVIFRMTDQPNGVGNRQQLIGKKTNNTIGQYNLITLTDIQE